MILPVIIILGGWWWWWWWWGGDLPITHLRCRILLWLQVNLGPSSLWSDEEHLSGMHLIRERSRDDRQEGGNQLVQLGHSCQLKSPDVALQPPRV